MQMPESDSFTLQIFQELHVDFRELQKALGDVLPQYMIPRIFIPIHKLPLTSSMKVDRRELRSRGRDLTEEEFSNYSLEKIPKRAPSTEAEKLLQSLWGEALGISDSESIVGIDNNFFWIGGDSIMAIKLISMDRAVGVSLTVADVFRFPRLANAAALISTKPNDVNRSPESFQPFSQLGVQNRDGFLRDVVCHRTKVQRESILDVLEKTDFQAWAIASSLTKFGFGLNYFFFRRRGSIGH